MKAAVVLGASGSVGNALIKELIRNGSLKPVVTLVRRSQPDQVAMARGAGVELRETLVPAMDPASLETATLTAIRSLEGDVVGLSVLGVGAGTAKLTLDEHRAVDVQLNAAFARALKASGRVKHLAFMSAAGADPAAAATGSGAAGMARYARVKGEAEEAVKEGGPAVVSIFRPAMIIGSQHTPWLLEKVLPVVLVRDAREIPIDHRRADREGDGRDVREHAREIGRLPLPRNDGVEPVIASTPRREGVVDARARLVLFWSDFRWPDHYWSRDGDKSGGRLPRNRNVAV